MSIDWVTPQRWANPRRIKIGEENRATANAMKWGMISTVAHPFFGPLARGLVGALPDEVICLHHRPSSPRRDKAPTRRKLRGDRETCRALAGPFRVRGRVGGVGHGLVL